MKFTHTSPKDGDIQIRKFFAWFPIRIQNETRWLEQVKIEQHYFDGGPLGLIYGGNQWCNDKFINE